MISFKKTSVILMLASFLVINAQAQTGLIKEAGRQFDMMSYANAIELFEKALKEQNDTVRYSLYRQADQTVMEDAPVVPLWYDKIIRLVQNGIEGFEPNGLNLLELRKTHIQY